jgi:hypothetical protein
LKKKSSRGKEELKAGLAAVAVAVLLLFMLNFWGFGPHLLPR